jgi:hypothetical protein
MSEDAKNEIMNVYKWMIPYKLNSTLHFENEIILNMDIDMSKKYVGQVTYNLARDKCDIFKHINIEKLLTLTNTDVVTLYHNPYDRLNQLNSTFINIWTILLKKLLPNDIDVVSDSIQLFYCNYWFAKPEIMKDYQEFLRKAVILLEEDPEVYGDYGHISQSNIPKERLVQISGKPYYTYHSFILERLPCIFFWYKGYSIRHGNIIN